MTDIEINKLIQVDKSKISSSLKEEQNKLKNCEEEDDNNNNLNGQKFYLLSREDVIKKRIERKKSKKEAKAREQEIKFFEEKVWKKSDKIKTLNAEEFNKIKLSKITESNAAKPRKLPSFNIFDFVIVKSKNKTKKFESRKVKNVNTKLRNNYGFLCTKKNQARSRLKKAILKARIEKKKLASTNCELNLSRIELNDTSPQLDKILNFSEITESPDNIKQSEISEAIESTVLDLKAMSVSDTNIEKATIHSRKFRSYCDNLTPPLLRTLTENLIRKIHMFQKRALQKNEIKAKAHRRYVMGFSETTRGLITEKIKLVIIAPDCEKCFTPDGIEERVEWIKAKCKENKVPYLFSLRARQIAYCLYLKVPVHCLGIFSYEGANDIYNELIKNLVIERENYLKLISGNSEDYENSTKNHDEDKK